MDGEKLVVPSRTRLYYEQLDTPDSNEREKVDGTKFFKCFDLLFSDVSTAMWVEQSASIATLIVSWGCSQDTRKCGKADGCYFHTREER